MWPYVLTFIAVAVFPLALGGYGGHLATLALPKGSTQKRKAITIVWFLAIVGILLFGASQISTYRADKSRDRRDEDFRTDVNGKLKHITDEADCEKRKQEANDLKASIKTNIKGGKAAPINPNPEVSGAFTLLPFSQRSTPRPDPKGKPPLSELHIQVTITPKTPISRGYIVVEFDRDWGSVEIDDHYSTCGCTPAWLSDGIANESLVEYLKRRPSTTVYVVRLEKAVINSDNPLIVGADAIGNQIKVTRVMHYR